MPPKGKKTVPNHSFPNHLAEFMDTIEIKEDFDDPKERARRAAAKRKQKEEAAANAKKTTFNNKFDAEEIRLLVKTFKMEFPQGNFNKRGTVDLIQKVFPKYDADCVMKNIFEIFDSLNTGRVSNNEILWVFSMAMKGSVEEKLHWLFKLYDKDGNGEISQEEMDDVFMKMCKIVEKTEIDHLRKHRKFDPVKRSREIFSALDANGDGCVTEDEFINGCLSDDTFIKVMDDLCLDFLWGI